jgi:hypothetical protein
MFSGVSLNVVKIRLIRLGSCRSAIELRPRINEINHLEILTVNFICHFFADFGGLSCPPLILHRAEAVFKPIRPQRSLATNYMGSSKNVEAN